jgi:hypothetical protein
MMLSIKLNERFTSMVSEAPMPTTSLNMFPRAAAAMVDKLNATPSRIMTQVQVLLIIIIIIKEEVGGDTLKQWWTFTNIS